MQPTADPSTTALTSVDIDIRPGITLPVPDDVAAAAARDRLASIDIGISAPTVTALGTLTESVMFVAGVQATAYPRPFLSSRVVLLTGAHSGGVVAGPSPDPRGSIPLQHLAANTGAGLVTLEWQPAAAAIELEDAITPEQMDAALQAGWAEAERAADEGIELLILAAGGAGASTAAAAVVAAATGAEPTAMLSRVVTPAGLYDDNAWMTRCLAVRDALHRVRDRDGDPRTVLAALGGADIAAATGLVLGAASRRTPVMFDGPVGAAAALLANDFAPQAKRWLLLPDTGRHMAVRIAAEALELHPWLDLCLDLGEGSAALAALPLLQTALTLATSGEPVEPMPLTRIDSTGGQVFVGVARPVEPTISEDEPAEVASVPAQAGAPASESTPPAKKAGSKGQSGRRGKQVPTRSVTPPKPTPPKSAPAKAGPRPTPAKTGGPTADATTADAAATDAAATDATAVDATAGAGAAEPAATADRATADRAAGDSPRGSSGPSAEDTGTIAAIAAASKDSAARVAARDAAAKEAARSAAAKDGAAKDGAAKDGAAKDGATRDAAAKDAAAKHGATDGAAKDGVASTSDGSTSISDTSRSTDSTVDKAPGSNGTKPGEPVTAGAPSGATPPRPRKRT